MRIYRTLMAFSDSAPGKVFLSDTIEYDNKFWLVPEWTENKLIRKMRPTRIILLNSLPHQKTNNPAAPADFFLNKPIPKCVFDGQVPPETTFEFHIVENPEIFLDIPTVQ